MGDLEGLKIMKKGLILLLLGLAVTMSGQELKCNVTMNYDAVQSANTSVMDHLKQSIMECLNTTRWTNMTFAETERIDCNFMLIVHSVGEDGLYTCDLQIQSNRPIYGTTYNSPLLNFKDASFCFMYQDYDQIIYDKSNYTTNLASLIGYYAYLVIGHDCDSYEKLGGTPYFQICEQICSRCQGQSMADAEQKGWKAFDSNRNRYALMNNLMDDAFKPYREYYYTYHRLGLDEMSANVANGRARIAKDIAVLRDANRARPATYAINTFLDAKADELVNIFSEGTQEEKKQVYDVLTAIDPTRTDLYDGMMK